MKLKVKDQIPDSKIFHLVDGEPKEQNISEVLGTNKIILFGLPGAFTATCSKFHLPGFVTNSQKILDKGIDHIFCLAVNDPFVMKAWCDANKAGNDIIFIADGNASLSKSIGLTFDGSMYSLGVRSQRFAMILTGLKVEKLFVEKPGVFDVSSAQKVLASLV